MAKRKGLFTIFTTVLITFVIATLVFGCRTIGAPTLTLVFIQMESRPNRVYYQEGEYFDPTGLVIFAHYLGGSGRMVGMCGAVDWNESEYEIEHTKLTFYPELTTPLTMIVTEIVVEYKGFRRTIPITVAID